MEEDSIPGAVVVVVDSGRVIYKRGFGVADLATGRRVDPDSTLFRMGSITKILTSLGILRLEEQNALALDTPVREVVSLPALDLRPEDPVRISHLMSHTGGFDQTGLGRHASSAAERPSLQGMLEEYLVPVRPPGRVATYDTYGMTLAGLVLEAISGEPYADFMRSQVFEPLQMYDTFIESPPEYRDRLAVGYGLRDGTHVVQPYELYTTLPASSADATAGDMARLMVALLGDGPAAGGRLLRPQTVRSLMEGAFAVADPPFWYGWWAGRAGGQPVLQHGGVMRGFSAQLVLLPGRRAGLFVAYNRDPETGPPPRLRDRLTDAFLLHMLIEQPATTPSTYVPVPTDAFEGWWASTLGCFTCREGEGWPVRLERIESAGSGTLRFRDARWLAVDSLTFRSDNSGTMLRFARDDAKRIVYASVGHDGYERLDAQLVARVSAVLGPDREPETLRTLLAQVAAQEERPRALAALAARAPTVDPAGTYLFNPVGMEDSEPMRAEVQKSDGSVEGWVQPRPDRPRRYIREVIVGGNEVWLVVEVPGGVLDIQFVIEGEDVSGTIREGLEEIQVTGRHIPHER